MHLRDKLSLREITNRTGLSCNTIRRWLRSAKGRHSQRMLRAIGLPLRLKAIEAKNKCIAQSIRAENHVFPEICACYLELVYVQLRLMSPLAHIPLLSARLSLRSTR